MVLVVDVGNTNITFGVYDRKNLVTTFRLMAKTQRTSDEYGVLITELLSKTISTPERLRAPSLQASCQQLCMRSPAASSAMCLSG